MIFGSLKSSNENLFYISIFNKRNLLVKVIFLRNLFLDLISIHNLRAMARCPVDLNFIPPISVCWTPSGVLGYDSLPQKKKFRDDIADPSIVWSKLTKFWIFFSNIYFICSAAKHGHFYLNFQKGMVAPEFFYWSGNCGYLKISH